MTRPAEAAARDPGGAVAAQWSRLLDLPRFPTGDGRQRLRRLLAPLMEHPAWRERDAIKITGSNGKGSTAAMTAAILQAAGVSTGLFTSPHLRTPNERFVIDGTPFDHRAFVRSAQWAIARIEADEREHQGECAGVFETLTALAVHAFTAAGAEAWILEAGIGGRLDPTGVVPGRLSAIVSIDLEHTQLLGPTEDAIARDKADLADNRSTLLLGHLNASLRAAVRQHVQPRGVSVHGAEADCTLVAARQRDTGTRVDLACGARRLDDVAIGFHGAHQANNAALATALAQRWLARHRPDLLVDQLDTAIRHGLARATLPGRFEQIHNDPAVWVDVAHTPAATRALAQVVRQRLAGQPLVLVAGVAAGRDPQSLLEPLAPLATRAIVTHAHHRGGDPEPVAQALTEATADPGNRIPIEIITPLEAAIETAIAHARNEGTHVLVAGGYFLAAETIALLEGRDPRACAFF